MQIFRSFARGELAWMFLPQTFPYNALFTLQERNKLLLVEQTGRKFTHLLLKTAQEPETASGLIDRTRYVWHVMKKS